MNFHITEFIIIYMMASKKINRLYSQKDWKYQRFIIFIIGFGTYATNTHIICEDRKSKFESSANCV